MNGVARLDTILHVATPEGCEIALRVAGPVSRARAWFLDFLIRAAAWLLLAIFAAAIGDFGAGLFLLSAFLLEWFYPIACEVLGNGQSPGKRACSLAVVHDDGRPIGWSAAFIRNTLRAVDFLPLCYAAGFLSSLCNAQGKRLGDLAAGTLVVHLASAPRQRKGVESGRHAGSEPPPFALTRAEQLAIIEFCQRAPTLTPERAAELAAAAGPLTAGLSAEAAQRRLMRIGNFLLGSAMAAH